MKWKYSNGRMDSSDGKEEMKTAVLTAGKKSNNVRQFLAVKTAVFSYTISILRHFLLRPEDDSRNHGWIQ